MVGLKTISSANDGNFASKLLGLYGERVCRVYSAADSNSVMQYAPLHKS